MNFIGGSFGGSFDAFAGSEVHLSGGEFRLDGVPFIPDGVTPLAALQGTLSGTLADGTPFVLSPQNFDSLAAGTTTLHGMMLPSVGPSLILASTDNVPSGIRGGQTLIVDSGATLASHFNAGWGSTLVIEEGAYGGMES